MTSRTNLTINPQRLWDSLMETAAFGGTPKGGIKRLTVSDEDKRVRDWFKTECEKLGCTVEVDEVGNMFAMTDSKSAFATVGLAHALKNSWFQNALFMHFQIQLMMPLARSLNPLEIHFAQ